MNTIKILHTADWHLGQKLKGYIRDKEHQMMLNYILEIIQTEQIDLLIISGDVFDVMSPQNSSRRLYYQFLANLQSTTCDNVVIIGGNHDSPNMLSASKDLLESLNIFVVGAATNNLEDEIIEIKKQGQLKAVIGAVPFLRDQDLRRSTAGEKEMERYEKIQKGIINHYKTIAELLEPYKQYNIPIIATGHLYATGATTLNEHQDNIYMGSMENISAAQFPVLFDYIALGHIHSAQAIDNQYHIRYSGSIIPLSFKEANEAKSVSIVTFEGRNMSAGVKEIELPTYRELLSLTGNYDEIINKLTNLSPIPHQFSTWVKIEVEIEKYEYALEENIRALCSSNKVTLLSLRMNAQFSESVEYDYHVDLDELEPKDIFIKKCESLQLSEVESTEMLETFQELLQWELDRNDQ